MIIVFCESDKEIIARHIAGKRPTDYVFTPAESMQERWQERAAQRKSKVTPSQQERAARAAAGKLEAFRECYTVDAYRNAIYYAIRRANADGVNIPKWTPYQLRHTAVTECSYQYGIDAARAMAGHTTINMTAHYEHTAERLKRDLASKRAAYFDSSN
jgi:integrase